MLEQLHFGGLTGEIEFILPGDLQTVTAQCQALRNEDRVLGFDTESKPVFQRGQKANPICLVQLASRTRACLFRLEGGHVPLPLRLLLEDDAVLKVGINVQKELVQLGLKARSGVELRPLAQSTGCRALSLQGCAAAFLGIRVAKGQATSNWEAANLSQARVDTLRQTRGCAGRAMNSASQGQI